MDPLLAKLLGSVASASAKSAMAAAGLPSVNAETAPGHLADPDFKEKLWRDDGGYKSLFESVRQRSSQLQSAHDAQRASMPPPSRMSSVAHATRDAVSGAPAGGPPEAGDGGFEPPAESPVEASGSDESLDGLDPEAAKEVSTNLGQAPKEGRFAKLASGAPKDVPAPPAAAAPKPPPGLGNADSASSVSASKRPFERQRGDGATPFEPPGSPKQNPTESPPPADLKAAVTAAAESPDEAGPLLDAFGSTGA